MNGCLPEFQRITPSAAGKLWDGVISFCLLVKELLYLSRFEKSRTSRMIATMSIAKAKSSV